MSADQKVSITDSNLASNGFLGTFAPNSASFIYHLFITHSYFHDKLQFKANEAGVIFMKGWLL